MKEKILAILATLSVIWVESAFLFRDGLFDKAGNLVFYDFAAFRDVTVHLSLINEILNRFPPTNFAAGGLPLKNYHYFFDVGAAILVKILPLSLLDVYFRVIPVILSVLLCSVIYLATLKLSKSRFAASLSIFFTIFATSFGPAMPFLADFFHWSHITGSGNTFMMDQLFSMMVNPQGVLSIIIFLSIFLIFDTRKYWLIFFLLAISFGVKAYGGILFAPAAILAAVYSRRSKLIFSVGLGVILMGLWVMYSINSRVAGLTFAPFWLLTHMMADINRLNQGIFAVLPINIFKKIGILGLEFGVFVVGALGLRIFGWKEVFRKLDTATVFLYATAVFSLFLPLFFNQSSKAYEVVQFFPYFSVVAGILFSIWIAKERWFVILIFILLFLVFDKQELDVRIQGSNEKIIIPAAEMSVVNYIRQNTSPDAIFLIAPSQFNSDYLWFSALTARRTVYSGQRFAQQIGVDTVSLSQEVTNEFNGRPTGLRYDYVFVSDTLDGSFARIGNESHLKLIFENSEAKLYKYE